MLEIKDLIKVSEEDKNQLKQSYIKSLQNNKFKDLIELLNINEEVAMKYTSSLEDASLEFSNCSECKSLLACQNNMKGYMYTPIKNNQTIKFDYIACPYMKKHLEDIEYQKNIDFFKIPKEIKSASLKDIYRDDKNRMEIFKYFKTFMEEINNEDKPKGLYLHGSFGSGKTYLIAALFNELAKKNIRSSIIYFPEFLRSLKESFSGDNNEYKDKFNYIKKVPLLLLDDIGAENLTSWARDEILGSILQYRMDEGLPTFFTSNLDLEQLEEHLGSTNNGVDKIKARRIIERIKQLTKEEKLASKNRRQ